MRQDKFSKAHLILYACGIIPVVWLALLLARGGDRRNTATFVLLALRSTPWRKPL